MSLRKHHYLSNYLLLMKYILLKKICRDQNKWELDDAITGEHVCSGTFCSSQMCGQNYIFHIVFDGILQTFCSELLVSSGECFFCSFFNWGINLTKESICQKKNYISSFYTLRQF